MTLINLNDAGNGSVPRIPPGRTTRPERATADMAAVLSAMALMF